jgi:uncharacterized protein DUF3489
VSIQASTGSSPNLNCARSSASHAGIGSANYLSSLFRNDLLVAADGVINVITRRLPQRKTDKMTTSKKKNKNKSLTTKPGVAKRSAKTAPRKAEPALQAANANKPATAAHGGSKTDRILDLLKRPEGVTLKELAKLTGWKPNSVRGFLSGAIGKKMGTPVESFKSSDGDRSYRLPAE